jgi:hypothetical protein
MPRPRKMQYRPRGAATAQMAVRSAGWRGIDMVGLDNSRKVLKGLSGKRNTSKRQK